MNAGFALSRFGSAKGSASVPGSDKSLPPKGPTLRRAFEALIAAFEECGIRYAVIGGLATLQHTRVRTTDDIDVMLTLPQVAMPGLFETLHRRGFSVSVESNIREFRDEGVTTIQFEGVLVDLLRPVIPAYQRILDHTTTEEILGRQVRVVSAEGLIVMKLAAMRPLDEADIQELLTAYGQSLDLDFIRREMETFMDLNDPRRSAFESWVSRAIGGT